MLIQSVEVEKNHPLATSFSQMNVKQTNSSLTKGEYISNLDEGHLKNGSLKASCRRMNDNVINQFTFKISYPSRTELESHIQFIKDNKEKFSNSLSQHFEDVIINEKPERYYLFKAEAFQADMGIQISDGKIIEIEFVGLGKIRIGGNPEIGCSYNRIEFEFSSDLKPEDIAVAAQKMIFAIGLNIDLHTSQPDDIDRRKIMGIFHNYFPSKAFELEMKEDAYVLSGNELKNMICSLEPKMKEIFEHYDKNPNLITEQEILPGKITVVFHDIPSKIREAGGVGLMIGVPYGDTGKRVAAMLKHGPLSTQDRYEAGLLVQGASSSIDFTTGGGDSIFTRMITETSIEDEVSISTYPLRGKAQLVVDLDVLAKGGYAYIEDAFGQKNRFGEHELYKNRLSLWECTTEVNDSNKNLYSNEFMVKNHIPPSFIKGVVVENETQKDDIVEELRNQGIIELKDGEEVVNGKPLEEFIHVDNFFRKKMWEK